MKPVLKYEILEWADAVHVIKVRIYGTDHIGNEVDHTRNLPGLVTIAEVNEIVAKMNNGQFRS